MPKVSIVTPSYNCAKFIEETFRSVTAQSLSDWEWLITDDCSTDNSFALLESLAAKEPRIKLSKNEKNSGASFSRNNGLNHASGEYIAFLDADDLWTEKKLEEQLTFMESEKVEFSFHDYDMIDYDGKFIKTMNAPTSVDRSVILQFNPIFTSSTMIKRNSIGETRFKLELRRRQDYIFWFDMINKTSVACNVGQNLGFYRVGNQDSLSHNKFRAIAIQWSIYRNEFHLNFFQASKSITAYACHGLKKYFL